MFIRRKVSREEILRQVIGAVESGVFRLES
jgi:hypothetical protein